MKFLLTQPVVQSVTLSRTEKTNRILQVMLWLALVLLPFVRAAWCPLDCRCDKFTNGAFAIDCPGNEVSRLGLRSFFLSLESAFFLAIFRHSDIFLLQFFDI